MNQADNSCRLVFLVLTTLIFPGCHQDDPGELEAAARANYARGRLQDAEDRLAQLARLQPLNVPERLLRAQIAHDRGRLDEAIAALEVPQESQAAAGFRCSVAQCLARLVGDRTASISNCGSTSKTGTCT